MYPKVKVIQEEEEEEEEDPPKIYLKNFESLSLCDHPSNSPEHKDGYTAPYVRVPIYSDVKKSVRAGKVNRESNSKAGSVLPPRAVLSSPENDVMHGAGTKTKNKTKTAPESGLKNQNTHVKCTKSYELQQRRRSWK
ncbi:uncharacterized protein LOC110927346 isoform X2 [Helianthus annuus]|uniref:uncharacterized protein LOC110927346 isoform X2 n=1 Tax=Helianthus annuus TaxID=4232 RepID=UPI000B8F7095|nr:uncharacterized protein LOC110927346 isoform X2 [Helianthus annuus]